MMDHFTLRLVFLLALVVGCDDSDKGGDESTDATEVGGNTGSDLVDEDGDGAAADVDCDDQDAARAPGLAEVCDGLDNNCDGEVDEGVLLTWFRDRDGDGFGDPDSPTEACELPERHADNGDDCNDDSELIHPDAAEICDGGFDQDCDPSTNGATGTAGLRFGAGGSSSRAPVDITDDVRGVYTITAPSKVYLCGGTWPVRFEIRSSAVGIEGDGPDTTILDASRVRDEGSVVDVNDSLSVTIEGLTITGGVAGSGAGLDISGSEVTVTNVRITGNVAEGGGGGIEVTESDLDMTDVRVDNNRAYDGGGMNVVWFVSGTLTDVVFEDNAASHYGGAMEIGYLSRLTVNGGGFVGNTASRFGGAIFASFDCHPSQTLMMSNVDFTGNTSTSGGAAYLSGDCWMQGSDLDFADNSVGDVSTMGDIHDFGLGVDVDCTGSGC